MPHLVLRSDLIDQVRQYANFENSEFVTDVSLARWLDNAARRLHSKLVAARGHEYYRKSGEFGLVAGTTIYDLEDDLFQLLSVVADRGKAAGLFNASAGRPYFEIKPFEESERVLLLNAEPTATVTRYRLLNAEGPTTITAQIEILPVPTEATRYWLTYTYVPRLALIVNGGDVAYDGVEGWEEWIVLSTLEVALAKEESSIDWVVGRRREIEREIESLAGARDAGSPPRVVDVRRELDLEGRPWRGRPWGWTP